MQLPQNLSPLTCHCHVRDEQQRVLREMEQRPYAAAHAGHQRGTPHWQRGRSRAILRGQLTR
eukprot:4177939-Pyramimonas_sp.AAC.1